MSRWWKPSRDTLERLSSASFVVGTSLGSAALVVGPGLLVAQERQALVAGLAAQPLPSMIVASRAETLPLQSLIASGSLQQPILEISLPAPTPRMTAPQPRVAHRVSVVATQPKARTTQAARLEKPAKPAQVRLASSPSARTLKPTTTRSFARQRLNSRLAAGVTVHSSTRSNLTTRPLEVRAKRSTAVARAVQPALTPRRDQAAPTVQTPVRIARVSRTVTTSRRQAQPVAATNANRPAEAASIPNRLENTPQLTDVPGKASTAAFPSLTNEPETPAPTRPLLERDREP